MPIDPDLSKQLLESTKGAAEALLEDLDHLRSLLGKVDQTRAEIRRSSAILRRLLVEGTLTSVAAPRVGKVELLAPDNNVFYRGLRSSTAEFFASGGVPILGIEIRAMGSYDQKAVRLDAFDADRTVLLRVDNFLSQRVIFWASQCVNRREVIKYVANVAEGVHSGTPRTNDEKLIANARHQVVIGLRPGGAVGIAFRPPSSTFDESKLEFSQAGIDLALIELFAAARYLAKSPSVMALEETIKIELGA